MKKIIRLSFYLIFLFASTLSEKVRYDNHKLYRVTPGNFEGLQRLRDLEEENLGGYNFWSSATAVEVPVTILASPSRVADLEEMGVSFCMDLELLNENIQELIDAEGFRPETRAGTFGWDNHHTLGEINTWLRSLPESNREVVTIIEAGVSYENRTILGVKLSFNEANSNNAVFLESAIHAREWIAPAVLTYILNQLLTSTNTTIRQLAESYDWYIFPVFNPDGFEYSHTTDRMWRKTRVPHSILCSGADPNRNWDYYWNTGGTSNSPCSDTYRGPAAFSEPSVRAVAEYISSISKKLVAYISFHSFGQMLLLPYGFTAEHLDNYDVMYEIGLKAAEALKQRYGTEYVVGNIYETIYPASGSSVDWVKGMFKTPIAYGYELRDRGRYGFILPADQIIPTALETLDSLITIFEEYEKTKTQ